MKAESQKPKIVIWSRLQRHEPFRNIIYTVLEHLVEAGRAGGCQVILAGDTKYGALDLGAIKGDYDLRGFYKTASGIHPAFDSDLLLLLQLYFFYHLYREYNLVGIIGAKSGFMDAFGFLGIPQLSLEFAGSIGSSRIAKLTHIPHFFVMPSEAFVGIAKTPPTTESIVLSREKTFITNFTRLCIALKQGSGKDHVVLPALRKFVTTTATTGTPLKDQEKFLNAEFNDDKVGFKDPGDPQAR